MRSPYPLLPGSACSPTWMFAYGGSSVILRSAQPMPPERGRCVNDNRFASNSREPAPNLGCPVGSGRAARALEYNVDGFFDIGVVYHASACLTHGISSCAPLGRSGAE